MGETMDQLDAHIQTLARLANKGVMDRETRKEITEVAGRLRMFYSRLLEGNAEGAVDTP